MTADLDTIISRIRKLMALTTGRGATEAEAALASEHVQRLLSEHNLSMAAISAAGQDAGDDAKRTRETAQRRQVYKWQRELMAAVADLNFCKSLQRWKSRGWGKPDIFDGYDIIGREINVVSTRLMFDYLLETIERLARDDVGDPSQYFTRYAHSFKEGCSDRLVERLRDKREQIVKEQERKAREDAMRAKHPGAVSSNLPAVILRDYIRTEEDLNNDMLEGWPPGTTTGNRRKAELEREERDRQRAVVVAKIEAREAELIKAGYGADMAWYMANGYSEEQAYKFINDAAKPTRPETDNQRRKREQRDENERNRYYARQDREASRLDHHGYQKGSAAGERVGLDTQVNKSDRGELS